MSSLLSSLITNITCVLVGRCRQHSPSAAALLQIYSKAQLKNKMVQRSRSINCSLFTLVRRGSRIVKSWTCVATSLGVRQLCQTFLQTSTFCDKMYIFVGFLLNRNCCEVARSIVKRENINQVATVIFPNPLYEVAFKSVEESDQDVPHLNAQPVFVDKNPSNMIGLEGYTWWESRLWREVVILPSK